MPPPPPMPGAGILYALVARGTVALAEYNSVAGNAPLVALSLLEKVDSTTDSRASYLADGMAFHVLVKSGITHLAMTPEAFGRRLPFLFLDDVAAAFQQRYSSVAAGALAYEMNDGFRPTLAEAAQRFSDPKADVLTRVRGEVGELRDIMVANIEQVLERGERLELLVEKTENLGAQTFAFKTQARSLRRQMWWKKWRVTMGIAALALLALLLLILTICPGFHCSRQ